MTIIVAKTLIEGTHTIYMFMTAIYPCVVVHVTVFLCTIAQTVRVENFEVFLISCFSWVADDTKIIHVEGGINTRENF